MERSRSSEMMERELNKSQKMVSLLSRMAEAGGITQRKRSHLLTSMSVRCVATSRTSEGSMCL